MLGLGLPLTNIASILSGEIDLMSDLYCKAWVLFDGTAATLTPLDSYNVDSVVDNGVGKYAINFQNDLPSANYVPVCWAGSDSARNATNGRFCTKRGTTSDLSVSSFAFDVITETSSSKDADFVSVAFFGG